MEAGSGVDCAASTSQASCDYPCLWCDELLRCARTIAECEPPRPTPPAQTWSWFSAVLPFLIAVAVLGSAAAFAHSWYNADDEDLAEAMSSGGDRYEGMPTAEPDTPMSNVVAASESDYGSTPTSPSRSLELQVRTPSKPEGERLLANG